MIREMSGIQRRLLITAAMLLTLLAIGSWTRARFGIQFDVESLRSFAEGLGTAGPFLFVFVVAGRSLLALPSQIVLIAAGLCFGTVIGTLVGGTGLMLSGLALFWIARYAGREAVEKRVGRRGRRLLDLTNRRSGAVAFAIACAYPISPLSPIQAAAGLTSMPTLNFMAAAFAGGSIRALLFAYFGNAMVDSSALDRAYAVALFALAISIPLAFPKGRSWLREILATQQDEALDEDDSDDDSDRGSSGGTRP